MVTVLVRKDGDGYVLKIYFSEIYSVQFQKLIFGWKRKLTQIANLCLTKWQFLSSVFAQNLWLTSPKFKCSFSDRILFMWCLMSHSSFISLKTKLNILSVWFDARVVPVFLSSLLCKIYHVNDSVYIDLSLLYQGRKNFP